MRVEIITKSGTSFAGCAAYLLHDEGASTSERVAWTTTQNLGTNDPDSAWRVMAATAMDAERLKREAGLSAGRGKTRGPVLHLLLSWKPDEVEGLSRAHMERAAREAVSKLGKDTTHSKKVASGYRYYGDECQALFVCHHDKQHPHVHVLLNKVHPQHGRSLPDGNDQLKLSKWAERYERANDNIVTPARVLNNQARARGEYVKAQGKLPRPLYELQRGVSPEAAEQKRELLARQTARARAVSIAQRSMTTRHKRAWEALEEQRRREVVRVKEDYSRERTLLAGTQRRETARELRAIRDNYSPRWQALFGELQQDLAAFRANESRLSGRLQNTLRSVDMKALFGRAPAEGGRASTFRQVFGLLSSEGARLEALKRDHAARERELEAEQKAREQRVLEAQKQRTIEAEKRLVQQRQAGLAAGRARFAQQRADLVRTHDGERAKVRAQWKQHDRDCRAEWKALAIERPAPGLSPEKERLRLRDEVFRRAAGLERELPVRGGREEIER